jgi:HAMP domain-containing protein
MGDPSQQLASRAARASAALEREAREHPIPPLKAPRRSNVPKPHWWQPAFVAMAVAAVLAFVLVIRVLSLGQQSRLGEFASVSAGDVASAVVTDGRTVWAADAGQGLVRAFEASSLKPKWQVRAGSQPIALTLGGSALWVLDAGGRQLFKLSPVDGHLLGSAPTSLGAVGVAYAGDVLWVLSPGNRTLDKYDPNAVRQTGSVDLPTGAKAMTVATDNASLWVAATNEVIHVVVTASRSSGLTQTAVSGDPVVIAAAQNVLWVGLSAGVLVGLDPTNPTIERSHVTLPSAPRALVAERNGLAFVSTAAGSLHRTSATSAEAVALSGPGVPMSSLSLAEGHLVGISPSTGLLYATEVSP